MGAPSDWLEWVAQATVFADRLPVPATQFKP
jgi:hypothetical protein